MAQYGIDSLESFSATDDQDRKYFFEYLRKQEKAVVLTNGGDFEDNRHIPPRGQKTSGGDIRYAELDIPQALAVFRPNLSVVEASIQPEQEMANWANKKRAIATSEDPPFAPYVIPKLT